MSERATPSTPAPVAESSTSFSVPSLLRRMACWMYEGLLMFGVVFISGYLFGTLSQTRHALDNRHALQVFLFVVFAIYFTWFWAHGQTVAMKAWRIQVLDLNGKRLSQFRAFIRYLLSWLWFLPPLAALSPFKLSGGETAVILLGWVAIWALMSRFHPQRQFLHDALAGTQLVSLDQA